MAERLASLPEARAVAAALGPAAAGAYVVGGFLRDALLGREPVDLDVALAADPTATAAHVAAVLGGTPVLLDEERQTWRVALPEGRRPLRSIDFTRLRGGIIADLKARDFTINALGAPLLAPAEIYDPTGGLHDLERREIRLAGPAALREDGLRVLRAIRFAAELGFSLPALTRRALVRDGRALARAAWERRREELMLLLAGDRAAWGLRALTRLQLLVELLPELEESRGVEQPKEHRWDVLRHQLYTVQVVDELFAPAESLYSHLARERAADFWAQPRASEFRAGPAAGDRRALLKLACALHDLGKPATRAVQNGRVRFFGHSEVGAEMAAAAMQRLRFSRRETERVALLVREHLRPAQLASPGLPPTRRALYRLVRDLGEALVDLLMLHFADAEATGRGSRRRRQLHVAYLSALLDAREALAAEAPPSMRLLTGHDIMAEVGLEPGRLVGRLLRAVEESFGAGEIRTREEALALVRRLAAEDDGAAGST